MSESATNCNGHQFRDVTKLVGNAAALREALVLVRDAINDWNAANEPIQYCQYSEVIDAIDKALSVPPRNCDKYPGEEQAWDAFQRSSVGMWAADWGLAYAKWLLEPVKDDAEKKAGQP